MGQDVRSLMLVWFLLMSFVFVCCGLKKQWNCTLMVLYEVMLHFVFCIQILMCVCINVFCCEQSLTNGMEIYVY